MYKTKFKNTIGKNRYKDRHQNYDLKIPETIEEKSYIFHYIIHQKFLCREKCSKGQKIHKLGENV